MVSSLSLRVSGLTGDSEERVNKHRAAPFVAVDSAVRDDCTTELISEDVIDPDSVVSLPELVDATLADVAPACHVLTSLCGVLRSDSYCTLSRARCTTLCVLSFQNRVDH